MSIDIADAWTLLKARAEAEVTGVTLLFAFEDNYDLPDTPAPFAFFEIVSDGRGDFIEVGAGRASNRFRNRAMLNAFVFVPVGWGMQAALDAAEPIAKAFRRYAVPYLKSQGATVHPVGEGAQLVPPGLSSAAGNYSACVVEIPLYFDQTD
ncbi:MAG: hypothetical protein AB7I42_24900 [Bradyrhizobium sp.]|uniref:hypothetical protein n=1 Tax=Bradyrhizobium sp. TaxID=376 RepID=UPI003D0E80F0